MRRGSSRRGLLGEPFPNRTFVTGRFEPFTSADVAGRGGTCRREAEARIELNLTGGRRGGGCHPLATSLMLRTYVALRPQRGVGGRDPIRVSRRASSDRRIWETGRLLCCCRPLTWTGALRALKDFCQGEGRSGKVRRVVKAGRLPSERQEFREHDPSVTSIPPIKGEH